jgi:hypothetical protein
MRSFGLVLVAAAAAGCVSDHEGFAGGATVLDVSVYQGPIVPLVRDAGFVPDRTAPVLAGRAGRFEVRVAFEAGSEPRDVAVRLTVTDPVTGKRHGLEQPATVAGGDAAAVTVELDFDASFLPPGATYSVAIYEKKSFVSGHDVLDGVRLPSVGEWPLDARAAPRFRAEIVPVVTRITAAPTIDATRLANFRGMLAALYPVSDIELTVADPMVTTLDLTDDTQWPILLGQLAARRAAAGVDPDVFDYGAVGPIPMAATGGIAATLTVELPYWRVACGQLSGNPDNEAFIFAHELGHSIGRSHAPCGNPGGPDYAYPYDLASIGVPGLDLRDGTIHEPGKYVDFMSYCAPVFVSDYGAAALFESLDRLATSSARIAPDAPPPPFVIDPVFVPQAVLP